MRFVVWSLEKINGVRPHKLQFRISLEKFNGVRPHKLWTPDTTVKSK